MRKVKITQVRSRWVQRLNDYEIGLILRGGAIIGEAKPGWNWLGLTKELFVVDTRPQQFTVHIDSTVGSKFPVDFNAIVRYKAVDPILVLKGVDNFENGLAPVVIDC